MAGPCREELVRLYSTELTRRLLARGNTPPRTFGFEYELMPERVMEPADLKAVREVLLSTGMESRPWGLSGGDRGITFEPGGQMEFLSPPLTADDVEGLHSVFDWIRELTGLVRERLGLSYLPLPYVPGRADAPLLLTAPRYVKMHARFARSGERGLEMMKGTAAIHLHAAVLSRPDLARLFHLMALMARSPELGMCEQRRDIWDRTDTCRCGLPEMSRAPEADPMPFFVDAALDAVELETGEPFSRLPQPDVEGFLDHLTTIFTDVRPNLKGGTLELRTLDSMPLPELAERWRLFTRACGDGTTEGAGP